MSRPLKTPWPSKPTLALAQNLLFDGGFYWEMSSQGRVVLTLLINLIFSMRLHGLITIFTPPYYYIYNDFSASFIGQSDVIWKVT